MPAGGAAAAASASLILGGRTCTSSTRNQKINHVATRRLTAITDNAFANSNSNNFPSRTVRHRKFASSIPKEAEGASISKTAEAVKEGGNKSPGFVEWYEGHLRSRPVTTKAITGSILWGVGDVVAQVVPTFFGDDAGNRDDKNEEESNETAVIEKREFHYDVPRTARAVIFGFALHAPLSHLHFNFLEWMTVRGGFQGFSIPVFKTVMEQFVYWSWFSNSLYHGAMGAMQGMNLTQIYDRIKDVLWDTQVAQWSFWIPIQLINFQFVPVRHQLNVVLLTSVAWTALLSAWYPPESKDGKENERQE